MKPMTLRARTPHTRSWLPPGRPLDETRPWVRQAAELARRDVPATAAEPLALRDSLLRHLGEDVRQLRLAAGERLAPIDRERSLVLGEIETLGAAGSFPTPMIEREVKQAVRQAAARLADLDTARAQVLEAMVEQIRGRVERAAAVDAIWRAAHLRHRERPLTLMPTPLDVLPEWLEPVPDPVADRV